MIGKYISLVDSKPRQRVNFKTWRFDEKNLEETFCCKLVCYGRGKDR